LTGGATQKTGNGNGPKRTFEQKSDDAKKKFGELGEVMVELSSHAVEVVHSSMDSIRAAARGAELAGEKVEAKAAEIATEARAIKDAHADLASKATHLDSQASLAAQEAAKASSAAEEARATAEGIKTDINSAVDARIDEKIGVEAVIEGEKKKLTGRDTVLRVWRTANKALESAGAALRAAENAEGSAQSAAEAAKGVEGSVSEAKDHAEAARASADEAKAEAKKATDAISQIIGLIETVDLKVKLLLKLHKGELDVADVEDHIESPVVEEGS
jgi:chromosome segregation ATPase